MRVARAVIVERDGLVRAIVLAHVLLAPRRFVDVVAEERDQVRRVGEDVAIGGVEALLELLAGGEGEFEFFDIRGGRGCGACAGDRALRVTSGEAIEVVAVGVEAADVYVD
ncbi:hypothetical protein D3C83_28150 [compost metagenome]